MKEKGNFLAFSSKRIFSCMYVLKYIHTYKCIKI